MRILLVSDIHANWPALAAVREECDVCLCLGDLVDYGCEPAPCLDWVRRHATHAVRGNHDHGAAQDVSVVGGLGFKYLTGATRPLTRARLSEADRRYLADLPVTRTVRLDRRRFLLVHAAPHDPLDGIVPPDPRLWEEALAGVDADLVCVGHTHQQFAFDINGTLVVNPGSVGLPRDGDPRAGYAVLDGDRVEFRRVEYPIEETVRAVQESPLPERAREMLTTVYRTGALPLPVKLNGHVGNQRTEDRGQRTEGSSVK